MGKETDLPAGGLGAASPAQLLLADCSFASASALAGLHSLARLNAASACMQHEENQLHAQDRPLAW